jgi:hypothetical protein
MILAAILLFVLLVVGYGELGFWGLAQVLVLLGAVAAAVVLWSLPTYVAVVAVALIDAFLLVRVTGGDIRIR